jgi:archaellum component FlaD/FlaE/archaellum component FlaC
MGMMDWVDDDEPGDGGTESDDSGDEMADMDDFDEFDDDFDDEFDDTADVGDDAANSDGDPADGFDELDDFDGEFGDDFDDGVGGDAGGGEMNGNAAERFAEFEDRVGELETQLGGLSSTMNTVREENKQIGETVDELDDTIRKLLDIYEMVTRGINPFVDDAREMGGLEHGDGAFGLFDSEEEEEDEDLDPNVANADAESFFDEDFGELDAEEGEAQAEAAAEDELADEETEGPQLTDEESPADDDVAEPAADSEADAGGGSSGVSFDELKAEYDESEGWDEEVDEAGTDPAEAAEAAEAASEDEPLEDEDVAEAAVDGDAEVDGDESQEADLADSDSVAVDVDVSEDEADASPTEEAADSLDDESDADSPVDTGDPESMGTGSRSPARGSASVGPAEAVTDDEMFSETSNGSDVSDSSAGLDEPPPSVPEGLVGRERLGAEPASASGTYLSELPTTYVAESVAMEWMQFLVSVGGPLGASRALRLYEDFGWISPGVRSTLDTYLRSVATPRDDAQNGGLTAAHHETSLTYVSRLGDRTPEAGALDALVADGGSHDGIRR